MIPKAITLDRLQGVRPDLYKLSTRAKKKKRVSHTFNLAQLPYSFALQTLSIHTQTILSLQSFVQCCVANQA